MKFPINHARIVTAARIWVFLATVALANECSGWAVEGLANGDGHPLGRDFINSWTDARLALLGRFSEVYDLTASQKFQQTVINGSLAIYHYIYPPSMAILILLLRAVARSRQCLSSVRV
jgi:hypothetical protein